MRKKNIPGRPLSLILMGIKHCGKSSLGRICALRRALPFYDLDDFVLDFAIEAGYSSVRDVYRNAGREKFQDFEGRETAKLSETLERGFSIAALGGGTVENTTAMDVLAPKACLLYLEVEREELFRRIASSGIPPFLEGERPPEELFAELYRRRSALYKTWADYTQKLPTQSLEANAELLSSYISTTILSRETANGS